MRTLTEKNLQVLRMMVDITARTGGYAPTVRELAKELGQSSPSPIQFHVNKLVEAGLVERRGYRRVVTALGFSVLRERTLVA